ncbi:MAG: hypothetical protein SFW67_27810 [Myxococcaceae bacterium]|nr:hypothetical protein [Myxococcaceae bacterium]
MAKFSFEGRFSYTSEVAQTAARAAFLEDHGLFVGPSLTQTDLSDEPLAVRISVSRDTEVEAEWTGLLMQVASLSDGATGGEVVARYEGGSSSGPTVKRVLIRPGQDLSDPDEP